MRNTAATALFIILSPWAIGCGTAPNVTDDGGTPCSASSCPDEAPPESVCLEHLAADILDDGCGVFVAGIAGGGDDANPGTKAKPVFSVQYAIDLARRGRGRVFLCSDGFVGNVRLPSGVDLLGGFHCWRWGHDDIGKVSTLQVITNSDPVVTVEPASSSDTGAADGVSTIANLRMRSNGPISVLVQSSTVVEILGSRILTSYGWGGRDGEDWPWPNQAVAGPDGQYGEHACSAATVPGGAAAVNRCDGGMPSISGKGGDGLPDGAEEGQTGSPVPASNPTNTGRGGRADQDNLGCDQGSPGSAGALGTVGATGEGIGRISETGWEGGKAGDGGRGMPGQGGGGGGGQRGGFALCGVTTKGGAGGGSGGAGGCGGRGGRGGENGHPSIGIVALHAKVTVRDSLITTLDAGPGGAGGRPEEGGDGGRGAPGGSFGDGMWSCQGANGGTGGTGGYGGPGRGGDSIGIAYLDEDQLKLEGVTYELGPPGKGGTNWEWSDEMVTGQDGNKVETLRFPE